MVRHDAPGVERIAFAMKTQKRFLYVPCNLRVTQRTTSHPGIQPGFDAFALFAFALVPGEVGQFIVQKFEFLLRKAVGQTIGDGLDQVCGVPVWQIPTGIPLVTPGSALPGSADVLVGMGRCWRAGGDVGVPRLGHSWNAHASTLAAVTVYAAILACRNPDGKSAGSRCSGAGRMMLFYLEMKLIAEVTPCSAIFIPAASSLVLKVLRFFPSSRSSAAMAGGREWGGRGH